MNRKRALYIALFIVLGLLLSTILHAAVEIPVIYLLASDFSRWGLGLTWPQWLAVHHVGSVLLGLGGALFGLWQGKYWWGVLYEQRALGKAKNIR